MHKPTCCEVGLHEEIQATPKSFGWLPAICECPPVEKRWCHSRARHLKALPVAAKADPVSVDLIPSYYLRKDEMTVTLTAYESWLKEVEEALSTIAHV